MKTKFSWHFYAACGIIVIVLLTINAHFLRKEEFAYEMADLQAMRNAEAAAMMIWKDRVPEEDTFNMWNLSLIPTSEPMPESVSLGTAKRGGAVKAFEAETGLHYDYLENENYRGKILHVAVSGASGSTEITVDWVDGDLTA